MGVFGHDYPSPEMEPVPGAGVTEGVDKPESRAVFGEKSIASVAGEGQQVGVARNVVVFDPLAVFGGEGHGMLSVPNGLMGNSL